MVTLTPRMLAERLAAYYGYVLVLVEDDEDRDLDTIPTHALPTRCEPPRAYAATTRNPWDTSAFEPGYRGPQRERERARIAALIARVDADERARREELRATEGPQARGTDQARGA